MRSDLIHIKNTFEEMCALCKVEDSWGVSGKKGDDVRVLSLCMGLIFSLLFPGISSAEEAEMLWMDFARLNRDTRTIFAQFSQEKRFSFLEKAIVSQGQFSFEKKEKGHYSLLWEYAPPVSSGFYFDEETLWIISEGSPRFRKAGPEEKAAFSKIVKAILPWMTADEKSLSQSYSIRAQASPRTFVCTARKSSPFVQMTFSYDDTGLLRTLSFEEESGDSTAMTFRNVVKNGERVRTLLTGETLP